MSKKPRRYHPEFKFKVVLETHIKGNVSEVARKYDVNANQLSNWRREFMEKGEEIFKGAKADKEKQQAKKIADLESLIGKKEIEIQLLKKYLDFYVPPDGN